MKIMHLIDSGGLYGAEAMLLDLMVGQKKIGLHPLLCSIGTVSEGEKDIEQQAGLRGLEARALRFRTGLNPSGVYQILRMARNCQADILHSHGYKGNILAGIVPRRIRKIPLVSTLHGWTNTRSVSKMALYEWLDRRMLRFKDAVIVVNKLMCEDQRLKSAHISQDRLYVVNNGIQPYPPLAADAAGSTQTLINNFTRDGFIIGAVGRLSAEKGFGLLLEAIALLKKGGHDIKLVLAGDGSLKSELQQKAVSLGLDNRVLFTGYLANACHYLDYFDVLVISSLSEGLPIILLEAMRAGIPVISTQVGGIPDVIEHGRSGMLVNPGDAAGLAESIKLMAGNPEMRGALGNKAATQFRENYTSDRMAVDYLDIYKKLVSN